MSPNSTDPTLRTPPRLRPRRKGAHLFCALVLLATASAAVLLGQVSPERERIAYVSVLDRSSAPVTGLTAADFIVREDGVQREVLRAEPATTPIELTLLVDTSDTADPMIADFRRALTELIRELAKGNQIGLTSFGGPPRVLQGYSSNPDTLQKGVDRLFAEPGTGAYLLEALTSVAKGVVGRAAERPVILALLVRAAPEFSNLPHEVVTRALVQSGARFDAITVETRATPPASVEQTTAIRDRDTVLDEASRQTGGRNDLALSSLSVLPLLKAYAAELRNQYRVVYARPPALVPPEKFQVSVKAPGHTVRGAPAPVRGTR